METKIVALRIGDDGAISREWGKLNDQGGVQLDKGSGTWPTQVSDWGSWTEDPEGKKPKTYRAVIIRKGDTEPVPMFPKFPGRREHPVVLDDYMRGHFMRDLVPSKLGSEAFNGLKEFLKKIPGWAWFLIVLAIIFAVGTMGGGIGKLSGLLGMMLVAAKPESIMSGIMRGGQPQQTRQEPPGEFMYRRDPTLTMRTRIDRGTMVRIHRAKIAAKVMNFKLLDYAADTLMELMVSEDGNGRREFVEMMKNVYQTNIGAPPTTPMRDPAVDG